jgi:Protein of unknown function (DUF3631)
MNTQTETAHSPVTNAPLSNNQKIELKNTHCRASVNNGGLTPEELEALTPTGFKNWAEYEAWFNGTRHVQYGWIKLFPDEKHPDWLSVLQQALAKSCGVCGEPLSGQPYLWLQHQTEAVQCGSCREIDLWDKGYEIDASGNPHCWNSSHTREQRKAERERNVVHKLERDLCRKVATPKMQAWLATPDGQAWQKETGWTPDLEANVNRQLRKRLEGLGISPDVIETIDDDCGRLDAKPTELCELLDSICEVLRRYVVFPLQEQVTALALWVAHTWVLEAFDFTAYIHVFSAEKRSGKSRCFDVLELLVQSPWRDGGFSEAVLFRRIKRDLPTLLADEIDTVFHAKKNDGMENIRRMFNLGFTRGYKVSRCVGQSTKFDIEDFDPFCAKALCGIGRVLPDTVADRSLAIELVRQSREVKAARFRKRDAVVVTLSIRQRLQAWAQKSVISALHAARPQMPGELQDRAEEICEPLVAIADMAGGKWPEESRLALLKLCQQEEDASLGVKLLAGIRSAFDGAKSDKLSTKDIFGAARGKCR